MKNLLTGIISAFILSSCASTELVHISVLQPAPVTLPSYIKKVIVVNRTQVSKKNKIFDAVDKAVTLEGANLDKEAAEQTITGLTDELRKNNRFDEVTMLSNTGLTTNVPGMFPAPLSWDVVKKYCDSNNADALFSLELFDTDSKIDYSVYKTNIKTPLGTIPSIEQQANMHTLVKAGWRIYDVKDMEILDEAAVAKTLNYHARGISPVLAANALISRKEAVMEVGNTAGHAYAFRIIPLWTRVSRDYFVRGSNNFKIAKRKAQTGNWDEAAKLWEQETTNPNRKVAGRACYNMAIISEINGDLDMAIKWAQQSYENYDTHLGLTYVNILRNREANDAIAANQQAMNNTSQ
ncbi:MAG TPA: DUF6340 family protein [Hanamia sp.]|nr:DUF6340 family protein [Hanamia sp.]